MESYSREELEAEFGKPGVENPNVIDLIQPRETERTVTLTMFERRPWTGLMEQLRQVEEKINRYLGYVLDGYLVEQYPAYDGWPVTICLACPDEPRGDAAEFVNAARAAVEGEGLSFEVAIVADPQSD